MTAKFLRNACFGLFLGLPMLAAALSPLPALGQDERPATAIVLFDQSGSMGRFDSLAVSKIWLLTFNRTFADSHHVDLVAFDEDVHPPVRLTTGPETAPETITDTLEKIKIKGKATDLESPFRYLAGRQDLDDVSLILIITDGEPEIWDVGLGYLSAFVRSDPRYADLNDLFAALLRNKTTETAQYLLLRQGYHERNLELTQQRVAGLPPEIGDKTVIWDISGGSEYLRVWSKLMGAEYLGAPIAGQSDPVTALQQALGKLQAKTSVLISTPLPEDHRSRIDSVLSSVPEVQEEIAENPAIETPPEPEPEPKPEPEPQDAATPPGPQPIPAAPRPSAGQRRAAAVLFAVGIVLFSGSLLWLFGLGRRSQYAALDRPALPAAVLPEGKAEGERRLAVRFPVPDRAMTAVWTNPDGSEGRGRVVNASLHGLLFEATDFHAEGIERLLFPATGGSLDVVRSRFIRREHGTAAVVIEEFANNINNWVQWVGHLDRLKEEP